MPVPVITIAQMREWEKASWTAGKTESDVIQRVGKHLAARILKLSRKNDHVLIIAGKGNNGADARAAQEHLAERRVEVLNVTEPAAALPRLNELLALGPAVIVDGLFGIGLDRPLAGDWLELIKRINAARRTVLAVDVPSGLNADTGEPQGGAVEASVTLTVGAPKKGMLAQSAWPHVGRLEVATEVGLIPCPASSDVLWTLPKDFERFPPARAEATHKGTYGHMAIVAGSLGFHGAAVLAARGAQRAQPGLITLYTMESVYHGIAPQLQAVMVSPWQPASKLPAVYDGLLLGPGLAGTEVPDAMKMLTRLVWRDALCPVVVDASALDWVPLDPVPKGLIRVLTPHPGEAARLLRSTIPQVQANRVASVQNISKRYGNCWVVLKGHQTVVGRSAGPVYINPSGNAYLAQGGAGDVLGGYLCGLLAQSELREDVAKIINFAVWEHGASADALQARRRGWVIEDLIMELGQVP